MVASAMAIYSNLQSKDRQGFLSQSTAAATTKATPSSTTPVIEPSPLSVDPNSTTNVPSAHSTKKITTEKDTF